MIVHGFAVAALVNMLISIMLVKYTKQKLDIRGSRISLTMPMLLVVFGSVIIANLFPISKLGRPQLMLPYGLTPILNIIHIYLSPLILLLIGQKLSNNRAVLLFFCYGFLETLALGSKGIIFEFLLLGLALVFVRGQRIQLRRYSFYILFSLVLSFYFIIVRFGLVNVSDIALVLPLLVGRVFSGVVTFSEILYYGSENIDIHSLIGQGFPVYITRYVFGLDTAYHSSGTSYLGEFFLLFGKFGIALGLAVNFLIYYILASIKDGWLKVLLFFDYLKLLYFGGVLGVLIGFSSTSILHYIVLLIIIWLGIKLLFLHLRS